MMGVQKGNSLFPRNLLYKSRGLETLGLAPHSATCPAVWHQQVSHPESHLRWKQTNSMTMQGFWCCKYYRWLFLISHCLPTMFLLMEFIDDEEGVKLFFWAKQEEEEEAAHGLRNVQGRFKGCFQCDVWCSSLQHLKYYLLCSGDYGRLDLLYQDKGRVESFFKKGLGWAWKPGNDAGPWGLGTPGNWGSTMFMELCSIKDCGCCR